MNADLQWHVLAVRITLGYESPQERKALGTGGLHAVSVVLAVGFRRLGFHWSGKKCHHTWRKKITVTAVLFFFVHRYWSNIEQEFLILADLNLKPGKGDK